MWEYQRGVYPCNIRNNFVGDPGSEVLRDKIAIPDNNAFVTAWVSIMLLETAAIKNGPVPSDEQLYLALDALYTYHDNNSPRGDGTLVFWPQSYNSSAGQWYCNPVNIAAVVKDVDGVFNSIHKLLDDMHLESLWKKTLGYLQRIM